MEVCIRRITILGKPLFFNAPIGCKFFWRSLFLFSNESAISAPFMGDNEHFYVYRVFTFMNDKIES